MDFNDLKKELQDIKDNPETLSEIDSNLMAILKEIIKIERKDNRVMINETQYFDNITDDVWMFYIGGFQPAQRWLFDRLNKEALEYDDISNYLKIIVSIAETIKKVNEIDIIEFL